VLLNSAGAIEGHFEGRRLREFHHVDLILARPRPDSPVLCTQKKLAYLGFQYLYPSSYSLDLAPSDYHLFPGLKKELNGRHETEVIAAAETWYDGQLPEYF
jgi:hypothetical protein